MAETVVMTNSWSSGGTVRNGTITRTQGQLVRYSETITGGAADTEIACVIDISELEGLYIKCDRALTIETNDGTTPDDTITLVANEPLMWASGNNIANPLTVDVTSIFVTLAAGDDATLQIEILQDPTP